MRLVILFLYWNLVCGSGAVSHPVCLTEAPGVPNYCRDITNQLLFELYSGRYRY